jgi:hypothetical protein
MVEYKTTKIPTPVYEQIELTRSKLATEKSRLKNLPPEVLRPKKCPICGNNMQGSEVHVKVGYYKCTHCDYKQPIINIDAITNGSSSLIALGSGIIIGLGIASLLYLLFRNE